MVPVTILWQWVFLGARAGPWWCETHLITHFRSWCHAGLHTCLPKSEHAHWSQAEQWTLLQSLEYHLCVWLSQLPYKSSSWLLASLSAGTLAFLLNPHFRNIGAIFSFLELICCARGIFGSAWEKIESIKATPLPFLQLVTQRRTTTYCDSGLNLQSRDYNWLWGVEKNCLC